MGVSPLDPPSKWRNVKYVGYGNGRSRDDGGEDRDGDILGKPITMTTTTTMMMMMMMMITARETANILACPGHEA